MDLDTAETSTAGNGATLSRPSRTRGLMPPWRPGQSGNPSGLAKDGGGTKDHPIRATLRKRLAKRRALLRLVDAWIEQASDPSNPGAGTAREQILKRLDPVLDDPAQGRTILEGLRLELREGKASVTLLRGVQASSDADSEASESRAGERRLQASEVQDVPVEVKESQESPPT